MSTVIPIAAGSVPVGVTDVAPFAVQLGVQNLDVTIDIASFTDPAAHLQMQTFVSYDGGTTWQLCSQFDLDGGVHFGDGTEIVTTEVASTRIFQPANPNRKLKSTITVTGSAFVTSGGSIAVS